MALSKTEIKADYPLPVYNYKVTINSTTLGFSEISGLSVEYEPVTYKHGMSFCMGAKIIRGMHQPIRLTMKKGVFKNQDGAAGFLATWFQDAYDNAKQFQNAKKDILIDLCDESGTPLVRWNVQGALPVKLDAPAFSAESNDVAIESMELVAHDIRVDYLLK